MRYFFQGTSKDGMGRVIVGATISVYLAGSTTVASIYSSLTSTSVINSTTSGSATSPAPGYWSFYTDAFDYDVEQTFKIVISKSGFNPQTYDNVKGEVVLGTYTISSAKTITTHIDIPKGVLYAKSGTGSMAFNGFFEAGLYPVFSGFSAGDVTLAKVKEVYPQWFGAKGDGVTDDTAAIQAMFDAIPINGTGVIPDGVYKTTSLLDIDTRNYITIRFDGYIKAYGCAGIKISDRARVRIEKLAVELSALDWTSDFSGLEIYGSQYLNIDIDRIMNFQKGLTLKSDSGLVGYNKFRIDSVVDNKYGNYYETSGAGSINENSFYGGTFALSAAVKAAQTGSYAIYINATGAESNNNNRYYNPCFEGLHNGILFDQSCYWLLMHPRFEGVDANHLSGVVTDSVFIFGALFDLSKFNLDVSQSRNNVFIGREYNSRVSVSVDSDYGAFGFINHYDQQVMGKLKYSTDYRNALPYFSLIGADGKTTKLNKGYESAAAPATGTYPVNAVSWNSSPASGQPMGWVCSVQGTAGTLNSGNTTGTGTSGEDHIHVNSVTELHTGDLITIAGVAGVRIVLGIVGTTVYLHAVLNATITDAAVAYSNPTFIPMPNFP